MSFNKLKTQMHLADLKYWAQLRANWKKFNVL